MIRLTITKSAENFTELGKKNEISKLECNSDLYSIKILLRNFTDIGKEIKSQNKNTL